MFTSSKTLLRAGIAAAAAVLCTATPAMAVTVINADTTISGVTLDYKASGTPYTDMIKDNGAPDGTTVTLKTESGYLIDYIGGGLGGGVLQASGAGNGFAYVSSSTGQIGSLTIDPQGDVGFTALKFNLFAADPTGLTQQQMSQGYWAGDITVYLMGGGSVVFDNVQLDQGENRLAVFDALADPNQIFSAIKFSDVSFYYNGGTKKNPVEFSLATSFDSVRQVSGDFVAGPVPEPATWAMLILGMGMIGGAMRRRRSNHGVAIA